MREFYAELNGININVCYFATFVNYITILPFFVFSFYFEYQQLNSVFNTHKRNV